jgi:glycosyltransferase involved in cell wall biosynthesis
MACGTPVVATRIWGTPEVVASDEVGLLVEQRSSEGLAASLRQLLASPRDRGRVRRYAEGFGWEQTSQAQVGLFRELVQSREVTAAHAAGAGHA